MVRQEQAACLEKIQRANDLMGLNDSSPGESAGEEDVVSPAYPGQPAATVWKGAGYGSLGPSESPWGRWCPGSALGSDTGVAFLGDGLLPWMPPSGRRCSVWPAVGLRWSWCPGWAAAVGELASEQPEPGGSRDTAGAQAGQHLVSSRQEVWGPFPPPLLTPWEAGEQGSSRTPALCPPVQCPSRACC